MRSLTPCESHLEYQETRFRQLEQHFDDRFAYLERSMQSLVMIQTGMQQTAHHQSLGRSQETNNISVTVGSRDTATEEFLGHATSLVQAHILGPEHATDICFAAAGQLERNNASSSQPVVFDELTDRSACTKSCRCRCHDSAYHRPVPGWLSPWIGELYMPRTALSSAWCALYECNDWACRRSQIGLRTVKYYLPTWFAQVEATIRFETLHISIQTPRVVEDLGALKSIDLSDLKQTLSTRHITVHDTEPDGYSVINVWTILY